MALVVFVTCPDKECAEKIARTLVDKKLAACVNIVSDVTSVYKWNGKTETAGEVLLIIKTTEAQYSKLEEQVKSIHPYDVPEIIALKIDRGSPEYLKWVEESAHSD